MLYATLVVMTVMGCGDEAVDCDFIEESSKQWQSKSECDAAIPDALLKNQNYDYPVITARCEAKPVKSLHAEGLAGNGSPDPVTANPIEEGQQHGLEAHATPLPAEGGGKPNPTADKPKPKPALYRFKDGYVLVRDGTSEFFEKLGKGTANTVKRIDGAVKKSFRGIAESTDRTLEKLKDSFTPKD